MRVTHEGGEDEKTEHSNKDAERSEDRYRRRRFPGGYDYSRRYNTPYSNCPNQDWEATKGLSQKANWGGSA